MRALEHEQRLFSRERQTLEASEARMRQREEALRHREETFRQKLNEELETKVRQARQEIDDVVAQLKTKTTAIATGRQAADLDRRDGSSEKRRPGRRRHRREAVSRT